MLCHSCKSEISDSAKFCPKCGVAPKPAIPTISPTKRCPKCGTENLIGAKFCKTDGYRFEHHEGPAKIPTAESSNTVVCPACGTTNPVGAKFCKKDGVRLAGDASSVTHVETPRVPTAPQAPRASQGQIYADSDASASPAPSGRLRQQTFTPVRSGNVRKWAVAAVILLVLIGGGAGGYLYYTGALIGPAELKATISSALVTKGIHGISVDVGGDRIATLSGSADSTAIRETAVQIARSVKGVKDVLATLDVLPSIDDTESRLSKTLKDQQMADVLVKVDEKRNATLTGNVSDAAMIEAATKAAVATFGVKSVTSQIQVVATSPVTYSDNVESQPSTAPRAAHRPSSPPKPKRGAVANAAPAPVSVPAPVPVLAPAPAPAPAPVTTPAPERKRMTCEGVGGIYRLSCTIEGPETYFKCAPDGRHWNNAIPGCDRSAPKS